MSLDDKVVDLPVAVLLSRNGMDAYRRIGTNRDCGGILMPYRLCIMTTLLALYITGFAWTLNFSVAAPPALVQKQPSPAWWSYQFQVNCTSLNLSRSVMDFVRCPPMPRASVLPWLTSEQVNGNNSVETAGLGLGGRYDAGCSFHWISSVSTPFGIWLSIATLVLLMLITCANVCSCCCLFGLESQPQPDRPWNNWSCLRCCLCCANDCIVGDAGDCCCSDNCRAQINSDDNTTAAADTFYHCMSFVRTTGFFAWSYIIVLLGTLCLGSYLHMSDTFKCVPELDVTTNESADAYGFGAYDTVAGLPLFASLQQGCVGEITTRAQLDWAMSLVTAFPNEHPDAAVSASALTANGEPKTLCDTRVLSLQDNKRLSLALEQNDSRLRLIWLVGCLLFVVGALLLPCICNLSMQRRCFLGCRVCCGVTPQNVPSHKLVAPLVQVSSFAVPAAKGAVLPGLSAEIQPPAQVMLAAKYKTIVLSASRALESLSQGDAKQTAPSAASSLTEVESAQTKLRLEATKQSCDSPVSLAASLPPSAPYAEAPHAQFPALDSYSLLRNEVGRETHLNIQQDATTATETLRTPLLGSFQVDVSTSNSASNQDASIG
jgi:hypothetical protein